VRIAVRVTDGPIRFEQLDDYRKFGEDLDFIVRDTGNGLYTKLILIHAIIEQAMTEYEGISGDEIDAWDEYHTASLEPGDEEGCPYGKAHKLATQVERLICAELGINWVDYEEALETQND
jgi:hypothetical protein